MLSLPNRSCRILEGARLPAGSNNFVAYACPAVFESGSAWKTFFHIRFVKQSSSADRARERENVRYSIGYLTAAEVHVVEGGIVGVVGEARVGLHTLGQGEAAVLAVHFSLYLNGGGGEGIGSV